MELKKYIVKSYRLDVNITAHAEGVAAMDVLRAQAKRHHPGFICKSDSIQEQGYYLIYTAKGHMA